MAGGLPLRPLRGDRAYFLPSKRVVYECAGCGRQVSVIAGRIFEQSKKPLVRWFRALFEITASKQGIAAAELQRKLGLGSYQPKSGGSALAGRRYLVDSMRNVEACRSSPGSPCG